MNTLAHPRSQTYKTSLEAYLRDCREESHLGMDEEYELAERVAEGDPEAREQLVRANLWLVVNIARQYRSRQVELDDLIEEGNLGLLRAVESFDVSRGTRFSTYAAYWIRQSIRRGAINAEGMIRLPYYTMQMLFEWRRTVAQLQGEFGRAPSKEEVAAYLGWTTRQICTIERVLHVLKVNQQPDSPTNTVSLENTVMDHEMPAGLFGDFDSDTVNHVLKLVNTLPDRDADILRLRFGLDGGRTHTLQEVGDRFGVTKSRISQQEKAALRKLRVMLQREGLISSPVQCGCA